ncbi:MAG: RNA 2',3'-cyclic phosphodiesterase [Carbonactinosporaceae bacterium]
MDHGRDTVRLFVALQPPDEVLEELAEATAALRRAHPALRWTRPEQWHLTLAFLGEVGEDRLPALRERLERVAGRHAPLTLSLTGGDRFGREVLWAGVAGDLLGLERLAGSVSEAARGAEIRVDDRPYRPHLTLARTRRPTDLRRLAKACAAFRGTPWAARELLLVRSHLGRRPRYDTVASWPLAG